MSYSGITTRFLLAGRCSRSFEFLCLKVGNDWRHLLRPKLVQQSTLLRGFQKTKHSASMSRIIDLTSDDDAEPEQSPIDLASPDEDDEDLRLAIALSLQHEIGSARIQPASQKSTENPENHSKQASCLSVAGGIMGMDRKAMEVERLARLKRKREAEGQPPSPSSKRISPPPLPKHKQSQAPAHSASLTRSTGSVPPSNPFSFTKPRVLLTSHPSRHTSRGLEAISFRDIVSPPLFNLKLKSVLAASFIVDFDWVLPHFDTATTKFVFILHAQNDQHRRLLQQDFAGVPNVRLVMPECLGGGGNMHSKIMLLFFNDDNSASGEEICRIVVPSANLIPADWGLGSVMENVAFVVDLPLRGTDLTKDATRFEKEMKKQLRGLGVTEDVLRKLETFNFDATRDTGFVHSMSGSRVVTGSAASVSDKKDFFGLITATVGESQTSQKPQVQNDAKDAASTQYQSDSARTGLLSLHDTIQSLGLSISPDDPTYPPRLDFITSSLGNLSTPFVRQLYQAACGHLDSTAIGSAATTKRTKSVSNNQDSDLDELIKHNLRIYFPTSETVKRSRGGPAAAGTVCFQRKWWETNDLIRDVLCDCVGVRDDGILMHSKVCVAHIMQTCVLAPRTSFLARFLFVHIYLFMSIALARSRKVKVKVAVTHMPTHEFCGR